MRAMVMVMVILHPGISISISIIVSVNKEAYLAANTTARFAAPGMLLLRGENMLIILVLVLSTHGEIHDSVARVL